MSVKFHAPDLRRAIEAAARFIDRRNIVPIIGTVRITADESGAMIRGTDLDSEAFVCIDAISAEAPVDFVASPDPMLCLLRGASGDVAVSSDGDLIVIEADGMTLKIRKTCVPIDWPNMLSIDESADPLTIAASKLRDIIQSVSHCISTEGTRYYLNGIFLHENEGSLRAVATDGHRLACFDSGEPWNLPNVIIPTKAASLLLGMIQKGANYPVSIRANASGSVLSFSGEGWSMICKMIDGTYPNYRRVIPKDLAPDAIRASITFEALRRLPKRNDFQPTVLTVDPGAGTMSVAGFDKEFVATAPVEGEGPAFGVNVKYLTEIAKKHGTIRIAGSSPNDPFLVVVDDPNLTQIVMPVRI